MIATVAINGPGRMGRTTPKVVAGSDKVGIAAINDVVAVGNVAYPPRYDRVYERRSVGVRDRATRACESEDLAVAPGAPRPVVCRLVGRADDRSGLRAVLGATSPGDDHPVGRWRTS